MFNFLILGLLAVTFALLFREGLWSNTLTLFNTVTAGLIATNYFEPITRWLGDMVPFMDFNWDVIVLGVLFAGSLVVLQLLTKTISKYHVRFHPIADQAGGYFMALWAGWVAVCFMCFMLHTAPLSRTFFYDGFKPEEKLFYGLAPDRQWLGLVNKISNGGGLGRNEYDEQGNVRSVFDPQGEFMLKYASRRGFLEKKESAFYGLE